MAFLEDLVKGNPVAGIVIGVGAVLLGPAALAVVAPVIRPMAKVAIKGGMVVYDQIAEIGAAAGDLFAEVQTELSTESAIAAPNPEPPPNSAGSSLRGRRKRPA